MKSIILFCSILFFYSINYAQEINLIPIATGLNSPLNIQHAGDERLFVVEKGGLIKIIQPDGSVNNTPFLNISDQVSTNANERGLLGLAFHPNYTENGFFYVYYTNVNGDSQISRFSVDNENPNVADADSELLMLNISQPFSNHNGGCIAFGPDGMLYIGTGDGGSGGDPNDNAQNLNSLLGKMLRLDVDIPAPYIPESNPYVGNENALDEIWAFGLRNPWKFSFDSNDGKLWIADVGQNEIEKINKVTNTGQLNFGWRCYEGSDVYNESGNCPEDDDTNLIFPVAEYTHSDSGEFKCSITGGYVYHGNEYPNIQNSYIFADYCSDEIGIWDGNTITYFGPFEGNSFTSFGVDFNNNLYVCGIQSGTLYKIIDEDLTTKNNILLKLSVYPNPTFNEFTIQSNLTLNNIEIYSIEGKKLKTQQISSKQQTLSIANFSKGVYFIKITDMKNNKITKSIIKK